MGDSTKWFVRGVPEDLAKAMSTAAKARGVTVGRLVTDALRAHLTRLEQGDASSPEVALQNQVDMILERLEAVEARFPPVQAKAGGKITSTKPAKLSSLRQKRTHIDELLRAGLKPQEVIKAVPGAASSTVYRRAEKLRAREEAWVRSTGC